MLVMVLKFLVERSFLDYTFGGSDNSFPCNEQPSLDSSASSTFATSNDLSKYSVEEYTRAFYWVC